MPKESLLRELSALREQLEQQPPLNEEQRAELELLIRDIELKLANEDALNEGSLVDGVNLAVERFEVSHPTSPARSAPSCRAWPTWVSERLAEMKAPAWPGLFRIRVLRGVTGAPGVGCPVRPPPGCGRD